jgi:hypothetical protein
MDDTPSAGLAIPGEKRAYFDSQRSWLARKWIWLVGALLILLVASRATLHRGYIEEDKRTATKLIEQFHERMNEGQFDQIYDAYDSSLKNVMSREVAVQGLQEVSDQFGAFKAVSDSEMNVILGPRVEVRAAYNSTFEKGDATELFGFLRRGHDLKLAIYQVSHGTATLDWKNRPEAQQ